MNSIGIDSELPSPGIVGRLALAAVTDGSGETITSVRGLTTSVCLSLSQFNDSLVTSRTVEARSGEAEEEDVDIEAGPRY